MITRSSRDTHRTRAGKPTGGSDVVDTGSPVLAGRGGAGATLCTEGACVQVAALAGEV